MITIRTPATTGEYELACGLVETTYKDRGYVEEISDSGRPSKIFIADNGHGEVIGTVGLFMPNGSRLLPTEQYYGFTLDGDRSSIFEIGRLAVLSGEESRLAFPGLIVAICRFAGLMRYEQAVACMKPELITMLKRYLKVTAHKVDASLQEQQVVPEYRGYFLSDPRPEPVYFRYQDLVLFLPGLEGRIEGQVEVALESASEAQQPFDQAALTP